MDAVFCMPDCEQHDTEVADTPDPFDPPGRLHDVGNVGGGERCSIPGIVLRGDIHYLRLGSGKARALRKEKAVCQMFTAPQVQRTWRLEIASSFCLSALFLHMFSMFSCRRKVGSILVTEDSGHRWNLTSSSTSHRDRETRLAVGICGGGS